MRPSSWVRCRPAPLHGHPGESLKGVYSANEFLTRSNLMKAYLPTSKTPSAPAGRSPSSAAATWQWTRPQRPASGR